MIIDNFNNSTYSVVDNSNPTPTQNPSPKGTNMTKLDFFTTREIPTSGHIMTIRDKRMHFLNRDNGIFSCPWGKSAYKTVSDTDLLYCFPTMETPYEYISKVAAFKRGKVTLKNVNTANPR